jgi:HxlR-like helix-turn-helix
VTSRLLDEITPTRLTNRLRQLEAAGVVTREPPSRGREVWYRLTESGRELAPVVDALTLWGMNHALAYQGHEPVHPAPLMIGTKVFLAGHAGRLPRPVSWVWRLPGNDRYTISYAMGLDACAR